MIHQMHVTCVKDRNIENCKMLIGGNRRRSIQVAQLTTYFEMLKLHINDIINVYVVCIMHILI